jgi:hypothetical protein
MQSAMAAVMLCWWWWWAMKYESWWKKMAGVCLLIKGWGIGCQRVPALMHDM